MIFEVMHTISGWIADSQAMWVLIGISASILYTGGVGVLLHQENTYHTGRLRYGHEKAFKRFRRIAASLMALTSISLFLLPVATAGTFTVMSAPVALIVGTLLITIGLGMKMWADKSLGSAGFFWQDMFMPEGQSGIVLEKGNVGPYRYFKNPMYGIGNLHIIGWALLWQSWAGILVAVFEISCLYIFYRLVEAPHIRKVEQSLITVEKTV